MADVMDQPLSQEEEAPPSPSAAAAPPPPAQPATPDEVPIRANGAAEDAVMGATGELDNVGAFEVYDESGELVKGLFFKFLLEYNELVTNDSTDEEQGHVFPYRDQVKELARRQEQGKNGDDEDNATPLSPFSTTLLVDYNHILQYHADLADAILTEYTRFEPFLRNAIAQFVQSECPTLDSTTDETVLYFCAMHNLPSVLHIRQLKTARIGHLSSIRGTITRTSEVRPELLEGIFTCNKCGLASNPIVQQYHYTRPTLCRNPRCRNTSHGEFVLDVALSKFTDWQKLRVQENADEIPPGSMPRSINIIVRNEMVERCKAGDACVFSGSLVVLPDGSALARAGEAPQRIAGRKSSSDGGGGNGVSGLKALGVRELTYKSCFVASSVVPVTGNGNSNSNAASILFGAAQQVQDQEPTPQEVAMELSQEELMQIRDMKASSNLYEKMVDSICPNTFGHKEVKRGILLMLLGGVHKRTQEGMKLRGDINVCIVGDPSTAKSQFLKYVHAFSPRTVYTSGKASSAAGLTAAVQRDQDTGEYCIEAGALMLADNGICCIDEFDKMDVTDQVAIHEAMEQQTISITKAGIQATLNARASILAAANPIYGRYDRTKTLKGNVALSAPILSRFDLFFVVLDECNEDADRAVANHILKVHRCQDKAVETPYTKEQMQRYIRFARTLNPKLTTESQQVLVDCYRKLRQGDTLGRSRTAYRITVRQLESMIRLSESLARLHCDDDIRPAYVREAFRLLRKSIIHVETEDVTLDQDDEEDENMNAEEEEQQQHVGEYNGDEDDGQGDQQPMETDQPTEEPEAEKPKDPKPKKKKEKTQITFEEYNAISGAIIQYLQSLDNDFEMIQEQLDGETVEVKKSKDPVYPRWNQVVDWYLEQCEGRIGDSMEELERLKKLANLVIKKLVKKDRTLIFVGEPPASKKDEPEARLAVHPNFVRD